MLTVVIIIAFNYVWYMPFHIYLRNNRADKIYPILSYYIIISCGVAGRDGLGEEKGQIGGNRVVIYIMVGKSHRVFHDICG